MKRSVRWILGFALLLAVSVCVIPAHAGQKIGMQDQFIASSLKTLAKAYVISLDLEKVKQEHLGPISRMNEAEFRARYAEMFEVIGQSPRLWKEFGISPEMTSAQASSKIIKFSKKQICGIIDAIDDAAVAAKFHEYLDKRNQSVDNENVLDQVKRVGASLQNKL